MLRATSEITRVYDDLHDLDREHGGVQHCCISGAIIILGEGGIHHSTLTLGFKYMIGVLQDLTALWVWKFSSLFISDIAYTRVRRAANSGHKSYFVYTLTWCFSSLWLTSIHFALDDANQTFKYSLTTPKGPIKGPMCCPIYQCEFMRRIP